jgi:hypothetical protein
MKSATRGKRKMQGKKAGRPSRAPALGTAIGPKQRVARKITAAMKKEAETARSKRSRAGKKGLVLYVDPQVPLALKRIALDTGVSVQVLAMRALNMLLERHGHDPILT